VLRSTSFEMGLPRVIQVKNAWVKRMRTAVPCTRRNLLARDHATCQYCGHVVGTHEYTIDHVNPRCQGGVTEWLNCVIACVKCNKRKGGQTPEAAGMPLLNQPYIPKVNDPRFNFKLHIKHIRPEWTEWQNWLYAEKASYAYWNIELEK